MLIFKSVLIVEDEAEICFALEEFLKGLGWKVSMSASVAGALGMLGNQRFDLAIIDVAVKGGHSGPIAEFLTEARIPFFVTTGYNVDELPPSLGRAHKLKKPYTDDEVFDAVQYTLSSEAALK